MPWIVSIILFWIIVAPSHGYGWECESKTDNYPRWTVVEDGKDLSGNDWLLVTRRHPRKREELKIEPGRVKNGEEPVFQVTFDGKIEILHCEPRQELLLKPHNQMGPVRLRK